MYLLLAEMSARQSPMAKVELVQRNLLQMTCY